MYEYMYMYTVHIHINAFSAIFLQIPLHFAMYALVCLVGLTVFAYYEQQGCDPLYSGLISSPDQVTAALHVVVLIQFSSCSFSMYDLEFDHSQILPWFMVDVLNAPGFPGLFVAVLFSGALRFVFNSIYTYTYIISSSSC